MRVRKPAAAVLFFLFVFSFVALLSFVPKVQSATQTFYSEATLDGYIEKYGTTYYPSSSTAVYTEDTLFPVGQFYSYGFSVYRGYVSFDTSSLPDNIVYTATLRLYFRTDMSTTDFDVRVYSGSYGSSLDSGDWTLVTTYHGVMFNTAGASLGWKEKTGVTIDVTGRSQFKICSSRDISQIEPSGSEYIGFDSAEGTYDPELVVTWTYYPTNDSLSLTNPSIATQGVLAMKQAYIFQVKVTDLDGGTNLNYVQIYLDPLGIYIQYRWTEATDTFSEISDPNGYASISSTATDSNLVGNQWTLDFKLTFAWTYPDETLHTVRTYSLDDNSLSDMDIYENLYYVENDLSSSSLTINDYRVNPSQTLTMSGYWYYQGTSTAPPDGNYQVKVKLSGIQKGATDTTLVNGAFSIDINAESTVGSYTYTVEATYMTSAGSFSNVVVDKIVVTIASNSTNPTNTQKIELTTSAKYQYDNTDVTTLSFQMTRNGSNFATTTPVTDGPYTDTKYVYTTSSASETAHGLNVFSTNTITVTWGPNIFIEAWQILADKSRSDIGSNVYLRYRLRFGENQSAVGSGSIWINGTSHTISSGWANFTVTFASVAKKVYVETDVDVNGEHDYAQIPADPEIVWDRLEFVSVAADDTRINIGATFELRYTIRYDYDDVPFSAAKGSVSGYAFDGANGWWEKAVTGASSSILTNYDETFVSVIDSTYGLTVKQDVAGVNVVTDGLKVSAQQIDFVNDCLKLQMIYAYDNSSVVSGNVTFNGFEAVTNASGWATFSFNSFNEFSWGLSAYGVSDSVHGITYKSLNQTIPLQKVSSVMIQTEDGLTLSYVNYQSSQLTMTLSGSGSKFVRVKATKPYYVKIGTTVYSEGAKWTYNVTAQFTEINESYSTKTVMVSWRPLFFDSGSSSSGSTAKPKTFTEEIATAVETAFFTLASNYVGVIIFILCLVGFVLTYFYSHTTAATFFAATTIYLLFDLVSLFILIPQQLFPSDLVFLQPFMWVPPPIALDIFGPLAVQQLIQVMMMGSLFAILAAAVYGVTQR